LVGRDCAIRGVSRARACEPRAYEWQLRGFGHGSAGTVCRKVSSGQAVRSTAVDGEGGRAQQVLEGPAAGEVKANTAGGLANASADFEQLSAQRFDLGRAPGLGQLQAEQVDQVVSGAVQQQAEGVGQEAVTAQAVGAETFLNSSCRFSARNVVIHADG